MKYLKLLVLTAALLVYMPAISAAEAAPSLSAGTATVAEAIEAGTYVYLRLKEQDTWIASNTFAVSVGDTINYSGGMEMRDFHSKALDRTFPSIYFVSYAGPADKGGDTVSKGAENPHGSQAMPVRAPVAAPAPGEVTRLEDGKTIADIFADSTSLKGQKVSLNAKVIKISQHIMGKNWITLQDGTGTAPDNKLMTTSAQTVSPGDVVTASGILKTDIDIGSGYKYKALLEETRFTVAKNAP